MAANSPIRILYVDDSRLDRELVCYTLEKENPGRYQVTTAGSQKEFQQRLSQGDFDVVLSDFNILGFQGLQVLDQVLAKDPRIPVIVVTGTGTEEIAVEAMKHGASDYVIKSAHHIQRLPKTIEAALEAKRFQEQRQAAAYHVQENEQKFRGIVENSADGIVLTDEQGRVIEWNEALQKFTQVSREEASGKYIWDLMFSLFRSDRRQESAHQGLKHMFQNILRTGVFNPPRQEMEFEIEHSDGRLRRVQNKVFLIQTDNGVMVGGVVRDVTEQRLVEAENRRKAEEFTALYETTRDLTQPRDLNDLLGLILERATNLLALPYGGILSYDPDRQELDVVTAKGVTLPAGAHVHLGVGLPGVVGQTQKPLIVRDFHSSEYSMPELNLPAAIRSVLGVPMIDAGELIGVIVVAGEQDAPQPFSDADIHLLTLFASQAAGAVHNTHLIEEARKQAEQLGYLYNAGLAMNSLLQPEAQLELLFNLGMDLLSCDKMEFFRFDPATQELVYETSNGFSPADQARLVGLRFSIAGGQGVTGWVAKNRQPVNIPNVNKDPRYLSVDPLIHSGLWVPVSHTDHLLGVLAVFRNSRKPFKAHEERLLVLLANQASVSMENARLFAETEKRIQQVQSLRSIDQAISGSLDLRVVLTIILEELTSVLHLDAADILVLDPISHNLEFQAGRGFQTPFLQHTSLHLGKGIAGQVALERKSMFIPDLAAAPTSLQQSPYFGMENFKAYFGLPLISKGQLKGVLEIFQRSVLNPDQDWREYVEALCGQAAIAVDNITLFADLQHRTHELALAYDATIEGWSHALDMRDQDTEGHTQRVTELTLRLAAESGLAQGELVHVRRGALLHDIGKMGIPDRILLKPGPLDPAEWEVMRQHPDYARELIMPVRFLHPALDIPYCHHEKWDGSGYPRGLQQFDIPLAARIFAVVDVWDALTSDRPYRGAWTQEKALEYIRENSGTHFDPEVVELFLRVIARDG